MIKRMGHKVRILEKSVSSDRRSLAAGMSIGPKGREFLDEYDAVEHPCSFSCPGPTILDERMNVKRRLKAPMNLTGWDVLYYRLRANFDGLRSEYCPDPPVPLENEGDALFDQGKQVNAVTCSGRHVTVDFEDLVNGARGTYRADFVIAADGSFSTVRRNFAPDVTRKYAGYVAWRGTVPEEVVSQETRNAMDKGLIVYEMPSGYIVGYGLQLSSLFSADRARRYSIPGRNGALELGQRSFNFIWYDNCPGTDARFEAIMTDAEGHTRRNTLPAGKMDPKVWAKQVEYAATHMIPPFREIVEKTREPFISTINDSAAPCASFLDDKVLLVGEALILNRPHTGISFNQSASHCLLLKKALNGEISIQQWARRVMYEGRKAQLLAIANGYYFQFGKLWFLVAMIRYFALIVSQRVRNALCFY